MERCTRWCFILLDLFWAEETQQNKLPPLECWRLLVPLAVYSAVLVLAVPEQSEQPPLGLDGVVFCECNFHTPHRWCFFRAYFASGAGVEWWG